MRLILVVIALLTLPATGTAQTLSALPPLPPIGLPLPPITSPLPPIGLPLPPIGLGPSMVEPNRERGSGGRDHDDYRPEAHRWRSRPSIVYIVPTYGWGIYEATPPTAASSASPFAPAVPQTEQLLTGILHLELTGAVRGLQIYVDGYFVGAPEDFNNALVLQAGAHAVEIRGAGYEPIAFNVKIESMREITYSGTLKPLSPPAASQPRPDVAPPVPPTAPAGPAQPSTFYFIPGCYMGNVPPQSLILPADCDLSRLVTRTR